ncbi:MAG: D-lactate dehydrogenase [Planctomycetota bacterium]
MNHLNESHQVIHARPSPSTRHELVGSLRKIVGRRQVKCGDASTAYYRMGFRSGRGGAAAVVFPGTLVQQWRVLQVCIAHACVIIMQAAKTGLTEGSCPSGDDYDRPVVIINVTRIKGIVPILGGTQVIALPGATLHELEQVLAPLGRVPHSVIGSTSIGATIIGGVANNAGGALCKRGSSYTELACFARVKKDGVLELVDQLGLRDVGDTPEAILSCLDAGRLSPSMVEPSDKAASDRDYEQRIRDVEASVPNRYNADPRRLCDVSGSAGKVAAFAVRLDTYPAPKRKAVFYVGTNTPSNLVDLRRRMLTQMRHLPDMCEVMDRGVFDVAARFGKDVFLSIKHLGTQRLPRAYALKAKAEYWMNKLPWLPKYLPDIALYHASRLFRQHLPPRLLRYRDRFEYHLIVVCSDEGIEETRQLLDQHWMPLSDTEYFLCDQVEQEAALLHRFAAAGAAIRYQNLHQRTTEDVLALDVALLGSDDRWSESLPKEITDQLEISLRYGHFLCHVFHYDYIFKRGTDIDAVKKQLLAQFSERGAKYPAEHNVGHLYDADETLRSHYESLDPTNTFNPGIGGMSKLGK